MLPLRRSTIIAASAIGLATSLTMTGCGTGELIRQQAQTSACSLLTPVIDQVASQIDAAITSVPADPAAAITQLKAARTILAPVAAQTIEGSQGFQVQDVIDTIDKLLPVLQSGADGTETDKLTAQLGDQMKKLVTAC